MMSRLRPRIGEKDVDKVQATIGQARDHVARIAHVQAHIGDPAFLDVPQARSHPVLKRLDADEPRLRVRGRLRHQMLAAAKADFEDCSPSPSRGGG
jgi:hypothetical protein